MVGKAYGTGVIKDFVEPYFLIRRPKIKQARQRYTGVKQYHSEIVDALNTLFDFDLPLKKPCFSVASRCGNGVVYYGPRKKSHVFMKYESEYDTHTLCHEESHRYHWHVNPPLFHLTDALKDLIIEAVALYAGVKILPQLDFNSIAKTIERWANDAHIDPNPLRRSIGLDEVVKLLLEKDDTFFREFVRSEPEGILGKLYPRWEALRINAYVVPPFDKYLE